MVGLIGLAMTLAVGGMAVTTPAPAAATGKKVVIVVGPVGSNTSYFKSVANDAAAQAAKYGAKVIKIYTPNATWARVKYYAQGANVLIYLGHGNGWPSPYPPFQRYTKDGFGLNPKLNNGNTKVKYWGEYYVAKDINLARNSVVLLMRLCYASGNSEPGRANPTKSVAKQRVDNYGAGFLRTNAKVVFAQGYGKSNHIFYGLYKTNRTMKEIFWSDPSRTRSYSFSFASERTPGTTAILDPYKPSRYYRSVIGWLGFRASEWR
ncbi:MAG: hypothetical protein M3N29_06555 [Chloroflexota bacterium]|nr:hypothetical protein [Chloroflexota bacterium]